MEGESELFWKTKNFGKKIMKFGRKFEILEKIWILLNILEILGGNLKECGNMEKKLKNWKKCGNILKYGKNL